MFECYGQIKITVNEPELFTVCLNQHFMMKRKPFTYNEKNLTLLFSPQSGGLCLCHVAFLVSYRLDQSQIILGWHLQLNKTRTNKLPLFSPISQHQHWLFNSKVCLLSFIKFHIQVCRSQAISWSWDTCHMSYGWVRRMDGAWKRGESRKPPLISRDDGHRRAPTATREWYDVLCRRISGETGLGGHFLLWW